MSEQSGVVKKILNTCGLKTEVKKFNLHGVSNNKNEEEALRKEFEVKIRIIINKFDTPD